ncbi:hypothetical protein MP638_002944 [Amoeboaphelidium occidentale]|nr:hypothetical protein MP638_002944 [Amoeboaphelidium occidentale]
MRGNFQKFKDGIASDFHKSGFYGDGVRVVLIDIDYDESISPNFVDCSIASNQRDNSKKSHGMFGYELLRFIVPEASVMLVKVDRSSLDSWRCAQTEVKRFQPHVVNISLGGIEGLLNDFDYVEFEAIINTMILWGCMVFASVGNRPNMLFSPARMRRVIAVGSLKINGAEMADFSSYGTTTEGALKPDILVPGENVFVGGASMNGTSVSSILAASHFSLLLQQEDFNLQGALRSLYRGSFPVETSYGDVATLIGERAVNQTTFFNITAFNNHQPLIKGIQYEFYISSLRWNYGMFQDDSVELKLEEGKISISILQDDIKSIKLEMEHISFSIEISQRDKLHSVVLVIADFKPFQMIEQFRERNIYVHVEKSALAVSLELLNYDYVVLIFPTITQKILKKLTGKRVVIIGGKLKGNNLKLDDGFYLSKGLSLSTEMTSQYFIDDCPESYTCFFNENTLRIGDGFYPRFSLAVAAYTNENIAG